MLLVQLPIRRQIRPGLFQIGSGLIQGQRQATHFV